MNATSNPNADKVRALFKAAAEVTSSPRAAIRRAQENLLEAISKHGKQDAYHQSLIIDHLRALDELCAEVGVSGAFRESLKLRGAYEKMSAENPEVFFSRALPVLVKIRASIWQET